MANLKQATLFALAGVCVLLILHGGQAALRKPKNLAAIANRSCERHIIDACATTLFVFGRRDVYLPQNLSEMVPHCQEEFDAEDCIKNFARKCLGPFERQVARLLILGAGQVLRKRCSPEGTREYLSHYACIKRTLPQLHDAMDQLIYTLMEVAAKGSRNLNSKRDLLTNSNATDDLKVPISCCAFARFQLACMRIIQLGCANSDFGALEYINIKMVRGYVGDVLELSCQGYEMQSDKCARITLPSGGFQWHANGTLVHQADFRPPAGPKPNSVVLPFLDIFTNL